MTPYNFTFYPYYTGKWSIEGVSETATGTLSIDEHAITLDVLFQKNKMTSINEYFEITGVAYNEETESCKSEAFSFILKNARLQKTTLFAKGMNRIVFDIDSLIVFVSGTFEEGRQLNQIRSGVMHCEALDRWFAPVFCNKTELSDDAIDTDHVVLEYENPSSYTLFEDEDIRLYMRFAYGFNIPNGTGFNLTNKVFVNVEYKHDIQDLYSAKSMLERTLHFFTLIWNDVAEQEYFGFRVGKETYWWQRSLRYSHNHLEKHKTTFRTELEDFDADELSGLFSKWFDLYKDFANPLNEYFETLHNDSAYASSKMKSLLTVIDGLTRNIKVENNGRLADTEKIQRIKDIINKAEHISDEEKNFLLTQAVRSSGNSITDRFNEMMKSIDGLMDTIPQNFVPLVVNTRHYLTHGKGRSQKLIDEANYPLVVLLLENVIRAYLMNLLGIEQNTIRKAVQLFGKFNLNSETI